MFHVPVEEITKTSPLRQKGKVAELACIAEDSLVLTDKGLVPIQDVTEGHLLWDGGEWVKHDGVVCRGRKEVMEYEGLRATADHLVWVQGKTEPVQLGIAAACGAHLIQTGNGRDAVRMGGDHFTGEEVEPDMEPLYVLTRCMGCGSVQWQCLGNLREGKSKGCQRCSKPRQIPRWLDRRLTAAKQRCENPNDRQYSRYGARGVEFRFSSVLEAGLWILENVENVRRDLELDRIDTNGHYEPGNLRFVEGVVNRANRRISVIPFFYQDEWPYARGVVTRKLSDGMSRAEIIADAQKAVYEKRKNWRLIEARLEFMIYEMRDPDTVLPYRGA